MTILEIVIFFLIIWWPIFFILLPIGFKPITDDDTNSDFVKSAPNNPMILLKFSLATIISLIVTFTIWMLDYFNYFSLKNFLL